VNFISLLYPIAAARGFCSELAGTEYISNVNFAGIDNLRLARQEWLSDFTTLNANVTRAEHI
jgi:hypothetical protein